MAAMSDLSGKTFVWNEIAVMIRTMPVDKIGKFCRIKGGRLFKTRLWAILAVIPLFFVVKEFELLCA